MKKVLVVGAGGFAGGFIVAEGLRRGYEVWAGVRSSTSREYLDDERIKFIVFDFDKPQTLASTIRETLPEGEKWDYVVYNLGATKVVRYLDFNRINYEYLRDFTNALKLTEKVPEKFLYMSSLSAMGPKDEKHYTPLTEEMIPTPNTRYGASKLKAEVYLQSTGIPYIIFRATGIYGPRDKDYFLMFESIKKGFDFSVGFRKQMLTFIYVEDLARAIYDALERSATGEIYNISEPRAYTQAEFRKISAREIGKKVVVPVRVPVAGLKLVSWIAEKIGMIRMKPSTLNSDKYHIMKQRNWNVDISKARKGFGFDPRVSLEEGVGISVKWYKDAGWLK
ncbi:MAG: NAD(P)-dependent oxidoreductase [Muribaculaceae bacterium]|nr:NAD(P)-dependent oxidoreductase [Muribaculaceae bacterium]